MSSGGMCIHQGKHSKDIRMKPLPLYTSEEQQRQGNLVNDIRIAQFIALNEGLLKHILAELVGIKEELEEIRRNQPGVMVEEKPKYGMKSDDDGIKAGHR
jgi:hypothetical protein